MKSTNTATVPSRGTDIFDLYLAGLRDLPQPLDREGEVRAAEAIEAAERACLDVVLAHGVALPELTTFAEGLASGELTLLELVTLGAFEGPEARARLTAVLTRACTLEKRCSALRTSRRGTAAERRTARERAWHDRARAVRAIPLHRERVQAIVARVQADLAQVARGGGAEATLGRRRPVLVRLSRELGAARHRLDAARNRLAEANLRLVVMLAKSYRRSGVPFADLVQEGNLGLMRAIDKFDHRVGTRFSTYAAWWIRQAVAREVTRHRESVRVPFGLVDRRRRAQRTARRLSQSLGRAADAREVAEALGVSDEQARRALEATPRSVALHAHVAEDGDRAWDDVLHDRDAAAVDDHVASREQQLAARAVLERLGDRERHILRRRFGLDGDGEEVTLREIGEELGLSRERIRQLEAIALEKLRAALEDR